MNQTKRYLIKEVGTGRILGELQASCHFAAIKKTAEKFGAYRGIPIETKMMKNSQPYSLEKTMKKISRKTFRINIPYQPPGIFEG